MSLCDSYLVAIVCMGSHTSLQKQIVSELLWKQLKIYNGYIEYSPLLLYIVHSNERPMLMK